MGNFIHIHSHDLLDAISEKELGVKCVIEEQTAQHSTKPTNTKTEIVATSQGVFHSTRYGTLDKKVPKVLLVFHWHENWYG